MKRISFAEYVALPRAHITSLKELGRSPKHFLHAERVGREKAKHFDIGQAVHLATTQPERFCEEVAVWPHSSGRRSGWKWERFQAEHAGQLIVTEKEHDQEIMPLARAVRAHPQAREILLEGEAEIALLWTDPQTGVECKGRVDWINRRGIWDLKTTKDGSPDGFGREALRYGYHLQAAFYQDGFAVKHAGLVLPFSDIVVEKEPPHVVQIYTIENEALELGRFECRALLERYAALLKRPEAEWPGYSEGPLELTLPRWAFGGDQGIADLGLDFGELEPENAANTNDDGEDQ